MLKSFEFGKDKAAYNLKTLEFTGLWRKSVGCHHCSHNIQEWLKSIWYWNPQLILKFHLMSDSKPSIIYRHIVLKSKSLAPNPHSYPQVKQENRICRGPFPCAHINKSKHQRFCNQIRINRKPAGPLSLWIMFNCNYRNRQGTNLSIAKKICCSTPMQTVCEKCQLTRRQTPRL